MTSYRTLIVDDQSSARETMSLLLSEYCPQIEIVGEANNIAHALSEIELKRPEIVFLDVEIAQDTGFDLLSKVGERNFEVIMVTAHERYALNSIKVNTQHFLLKPVSADELIHAVSKVTKLINLKKDAKRIEAEHANKSSDFKLAIPTANSIEYVTADDIIYFKADGSYTHIHTKSTGKITASRNLSEMERSISPDMFLRVHRSYIINLRHVKRIVKAMDWHVVMCNDSTVDVSRKSKELLLSSMNDIGVKGIGQ